MSGVNVFIYVVNKLPNMSKIPLDFTIVYNSIDDEHRILAK